ncbi:YggS family pyridoxal phosphate-dependent enzyme [Alteribacter keqinensis]|uniref:Pyridoxal phosphate homeostasis protein n=1 Tax=Alteribacter keqinensis TaxID=2483800 RepID=A0A3M7TVN7_9BACI|nr:YggS family pyridoxal phosphate-dependent enzyme [Alteribacter keqinensis]RNA69676.1 YggS family pyridoxal phosphate-dependent enzyme [Alteribacter keqinensis]
MNVKDNLISIQERIKKASERVHREPQGVHVVAVTKYVSLERTKEALQAGIRHIGENRVEGGTEKRDAIPDLGTWHFIGSLQSKKVKHMIGKFDYLHSLDRMSLAKELQKRHTGQAPLKCFVQVNVSGEESKSGLEPDDVLPFIEELRSYPVIEVAGLMTMAPFVDDPEEVRPYFRRLRELKEEVEKRNYPHAPCRDLSMGMSNDFEVAVEEGATFVRIGSALVGNES